MGLEIVMPTKPASESDGCRAAGDDRNSQDPLNVAQYSMNEAYQMEKTTRAAGAALRAYVLENLDSKTKKSIKRVNKGEACKARSIGTGSRGFVGGKMRCGRNQMRNQ